MRQIFEDYFYPLSKIGEYGESISVVILTGLTSTFSAWSFALAFSFSVKSAAICYTVSALCLICLNFRLGVLIGEQENPPMS